LELTKLLNNSLLNPNLSRPDWRSGLYRDTNSLWLDKNENLDPDFSKFAKHVFNSLDPTAINTYPECAPLYKKLAKYLQISEERLLLTAGSDGAIRMVFEAFISPGDKVLHTSPTFAMYFVYSKMFGAQELTWDYSPSDAGPELRFELFLKYISDTRPKLVCLPNPDSPTGTVLSAEQMSRLIKLTHNLNAILLIDEAYHPFYPETVINLDYPHLLIARTFAKAWGLAGLRIGYLAGSKELMAYLHKLRPMYEVNTIAVAMMEKILDYPEEMSASVKRLTEGKESFLSSMERLGYRTLRGQGNFAHVAFGSDQPRVFAQLKNKVLFRPDFSEACLKGYSRFSSTSTWQFQPVIKLIADARNSTCLSP
jgi:histidinol-phosphate aminotransferase